jgi:hypothetical protein
VEARVVQAADVFGLAKLARLLEALAEVDDFLDKFVPKRGTFVIAVK